MGWALSGCGSQPPFAELPLRLALSAQPRVIADLPSEEREVIGARLWEAALQNAWRDDVTHVAFVMRDDVDRAERTKTAVRAIDRARDAAGNDAAIVSVVTAPQLSARAIFADADGAPLQPMLPASEPTARLEGDALHGRAGRIIRGVMLQTGATQLVRVSGWPAAIVVADDTVYVNAVWLITLASDSTGEHAWALDNADGGINDGGAVATPDGGSGMSGGGNSGGVPPPRFDMGTRLDGGGHPAPVDQVHPDRDYYNTCAGANATACTTTAGARSCQSSSSDYNQPSSCDSNEADANSCDSSQSSGDEGCDSSSSSRDDCRMGPPRAGGTALPSAWLLTPLMYLYYVDRRRRGAA